MWQDHCYQPKAKPKLGSLIKGVMRQASKLMGATANGLIEAQMMHYDWSNFGSHIWV